MAFLNKDTLKEASEKGKKLRELLRNLYNDHMDSPHVMAVIDQERVELALQEPDGAATDTPAPQPKKRRKATQKQSA